MLKNDKFTVNKELISKYSSLNSHLGQRILSYYLVPSPKDDLESLAYILLFYNNNAQIQKRNFENKKQKLKEFEQMKLSLIPEEQFKGAPPEFI